MLASDNTYDSPAAISRKLLLDRMYAEDMAWTRTPPHRRRYVEGFPAVVISRKAGTEAVKLGDLTSKELDALLYVPAYFVGVGK